MGRRKKQPIYRWEQESIKALRQHMGLSQQAMADEMGTRQQTVSEWETGLYAPRGASSKLLTIIAERARFHYQTKLDEGTPEAPDAQG